MIPSAPGKRFAKDVKVTDMLYHCYETAMTETDFRGLLEQIKARYNEIIQGLSLDMSLDDEFKTIETAFKNKEGIDYAASRGEYLNGLVMAKYLDYEFIDPVKYIFFREDGQLDQEKTYNTLGRKLNKVERAVIRDFMDAVLTERFRHFRVVVLMLPVRLLPKLYWRMCMKIGPMFPVSLWLTEDH